MPQRAALLPGLADDDVVEVPAVVDRAGPAPLAAATPRAGAAGVSCSMSPAYERLAVAAAISGDPADVRKALLAHPLVGQWDPAVELARVLPYAMVPR